jgi:hypothetical protein
MRRFHHGAPAEPLGRSRTVLRSEPRHMDHAMAMAARRASIAGTGACAKRAARALAQRSKAVLIGIEPD